jgi:hypothetical protein
LEAAFDDICPALLFPELHAEAVLLVGHVIDIIVAVVDNEIRLLTIIPIGNCPRDTPKIYNNSLKSEKYEYLFAQK